MRKIYTGPITELAPNQIFVFGSNTEGRHGKGAALSAMKWGAVYGQARGRQGRTYAIVTKDLRCARDARYSQELITAAIEQFYYYADEHPELEFLVSYSGTGTYLNNYTQTELAAMFADAAQAITIPENIVFEQHFWKFIKRNYHE